MNGDLHVKCRLYVGGKLIAGTACTTPPPPASPYVTVCGTSLCQNNQPVWFKGATAYGQYSNGTSEAATAKAAGLNTLEAVEFDCNYHQLADTESACTWNRLDQFIAQVEAAELHVVLNLSEYGQSLQAAGVTMSSPAWQTDWNSYLDFVSGHVNTVTHVAVRNDPGIAWIELWGEVPAPNYSGAVGTTSQLTAWYQATLAHWHADAPNILGTTGGFSYLNDPNSGIDWKTIMADPNSPVCQWEINSYDDRNVTTPAATSYCKTLGKPWFLQAWSSCVGQPSQGSWDINSQPSDAAGATHVADMYAVARGTSLATAYAAAGTDFWNLGPGQAPTCDIGPQFPLEWKAVQAG